MQGQIGSWALKCLGSQISFFMASLEVSEGKKEKKKWPNLNACRRSNNWDELEFIPIGTGAVMGAGSLRPCRFRAFLSKSSIRGAEINKMQSVLLPKMGGNVDSDSTRKAARKSQKLCICKSQALFQTFIHYTLPHSW